MMLPESFLGAPIAHRALHDKGLGRQENSRAAVRAAVEAGYGIEIDVQLTADGEAVVFHDDTLERLTPETGPVRVRTLAELAATPLLFGDETVPSLGEVLALVAGRVPLLVEVKDQDGALGPDVGPLEAAVARALESYRGDVAVMSFNPHSVAAMQSLLPGVPRGLTTEDFETDEWPAAQARLAELSRIPDYDRVGACFISHNHRHLAMPRVAALRGQGAAVLCWTIRSPEEEAAARRIVQNVTFEGYAPAPRS